MNLELCKKIKVERSIMLPYKKNINGNVKVDKEEEEEKGIDMLNVHPATLKNKNRLN
jgi:hypothetical protein